MTSIPDLFIWVSPPSGIIAKTEVCFISKTDKRYLMCCICVAHPQWDQNPWLLLSCLYEKVLNKIMYKKICNKIIKSGNSRLSRPNILKFKIWYTYIHKTTCIGWLTILKGFSQFSKCSTKLIKIRLFTVRDASNDTKKVHSIMFDIAKATNSNITCSLVNLDNHFLRQSS